jgi:hypothetical protein
MITFPTVSETALTTDQPAAFRAEMTAPLGAPCTLFTGTRDTRVMSSKEPGHGARGSRR